MTIRDGDWTLFEHDPSTGRTVWVMQEGVKTTFRVDYPVDSLIDANKWCRNAAAPGWKGDYHLVASVPLGLLYDPNKGLLEAHNQGDAKYVSKFLNDSDNRAWRTKDGRV